METCRSRPTFVAAAAVAVAAVLLSTRAFADQEAEPLLDEAVGFTGQVMFLELGVPGMIIAAVRGDESAVFGFGETAKGSGIVPDGHSLMRIGSLTKVFTGEVLAQLAVDGTVGLTDPLSDHLDLPLPSVDGRAIRLIDLATHASGLPRVVPHDDGDPVSMPAFADWLDSNPLLFKPGSAVLYSNFGFDLLGAALAGAAGQPHAALVEDFITAPLGMTDTTYTPSLEQKKRLMQGYDFDGSPFADARNPPAAQGASGLYATADDLVRWLRWHLDRFAAEDAELRLLDHAAYLPRDGLMMVSGMDESGHMDAVGLGWVVMMPEGDRPFILQKAGGSQGFFSYLAFAPSRGVGAFVAINAFDFGAAISMTATVNELISALAPR